MENAVDDRAHELVAGHVEFSEGLVGIFLQARGGHHVGVAGQDGGEQAVDGSGVVGAVAIDHHDNVGVNHLEQGGDHVALALFLLADDGGTGGAGEFRGAIRAVVVEHVDRRVRQLGFEASDDLGDRFFLLIAGDRNRDARGSGGARVVHGGRGGR